MRIRTPKLSKGFTIIEVMIVLAIAGVIMAIVFLAIPQLQRNSRDSGRTSAVNRVKSEIETYASTNGGAYPWSQANWNSFYNTYIGTSTAGNKVNDAANGQSIWNGVSGAAGAWNGTGDPGSTGFIKPCSSVSGACGTTAPTTAGSAYIVYGAKCGSAVTTGVPDSSGSATPSNTTANYAFVMRLDRGNFYCVDNG